MYEPARSARARPRGGALFWETPELLGHANVDVAAAVYTHIGLRLQSDAIDLLGNALRALAEPATRPDDGDEPPLCAALNR
ncbi:hypothetical protein [Streptomyces sp. NPDC058613]|uniref:hypothetical protein n=1 Tax=unclassified Streptomyces TaxID=2593676 RepID=UPI00365503D5